MKNAFPLSQAQHLTPFGQHIGDFTSNFNQFVAGTPDPKLFVVNVCSLRHPTSTSFIIHLSIHNICDDMGDRVLINVLNPPIVVNQCTKFTDCVSVK
jgi:hypothetical protein